MAALAVDLDRTGPRKTDAIETLATVTKGDASDYLALRRADLNEIEALLALTTVPPINEKTP